MKQLLAIMLVAIVGPITVARADDQANARAIVEDSISASGGKGALEKIKGAYFKVKAVVYSDNEKTPMDFEMWLGGPDKFRTITAAKDPADHEIEILNGKQGWTKTGDKPTEEMPKVDLEANQQLAYLNWVTMLTPLLADDVKLRTIDDENVAGKPTSGVMASDKTHNPIKFYFDKENHLLVKYSMKYRPADAPKEVVDEGIFSDYRQAGSIRQPYKEEEYWDGDKVGDSQIVELKFNDKELDGKLFEKP